MSLSQIIACANLNAARVFPAFDDRGTLNVGAPADVSIMELREGSFELVDNYKGTRTGRQRLFPFATVLAGRRTAQRAQALIESAVPPAAESPRRHNPDAAAPGERSKGGRRLNVG